MNDFYEMCCNFLATCWYLYVLGYGIYNMFSAESLLEVCGALMATWILIVIPAIIRGKW